MQYFFSFKPVKFPLKCLFGPHFVNLHLSSICLWTFGRHFVFNHSMHTYTVQARQPHWNRRRWWHHPTRQTLTKIILLFWCKFLYQIMKLWLKYRIFAIRTFHLPSAAILEKAFIAIFSRISKVLIFSFSFNY